MAYALSNNKLKKFLRCERCFYLGVNEGLKLPGDGGFPSLPGGMDLKIKDRFDEHRRSGDLPLPLNGLDAKLFDDSDLLDVWRNWRAGLKAYDERGNSLGGALDDVLVMDDKLCVLDYKTYGYRLDERKKLVKMEQYSLQLDIYSCLLDRAGYEVHDWAFLLFYTPGKLREDNTQEWVTELVPVGVDPSRAWRVFQDAIVVLEGDLPEPRGGCRGCAFAGEYRSACGRGIWRSLRRAIGDEE